MANLQESCINNGTTNAKLGRGCNNSVTNTVFGTNALNTTGNTCNVAIGYKAGCLNGTYIRTSVGYKAGASCTGEGTISIGSNQNVYAIQNSILIGYAAEAGCRGNLIIGSLAGGDKNVDSCFNVNIGHKAGCSTAFYPGPNTSNILIGSNAGVNITYTQGPPNIAIGFLAGYYITTGVCNIAIGRFSLNQTTTTSCAIHIGYNGGPSDNNNHTLLGNANSTDGWIYPREWTVPSDYRDKTDVENLPNNLGLNFIRKLRSVSFRWDKRQEYVNKCEFDFGQKDGTLTSPRKNYGFIAQEIRDTLEELNASFEGLGHDSVKDIYQLQQYSLVPSIIKAIQETDERLTLLEQQISN